MTFMMKNLKQEFDKSFLFKDSKYGINGYRFFPGSCFEISDWFYRLKFNTSCDNKVLLLGPLFWKNEEYQGLLENVSPQNLLENYSKELSRVEDYKLQNHYDDWEEHYFQHSEDDDDDNWDENAAWEEVSYLFDWLDEVEEYFKERFAPIASWTPFELYLSLLYKEICFKTYPLLGVICDIESLSFNPIYDKKLLNSKLRQNIKNLYLNGQIEKAFKLSGDLNFLKSKEDRNRPISYHWFFYLFNMFINHPPERYDIKKEIVRLFMENSWITESPAVKESVKQAFINKTACLRLPPGLLPEQAKMIKYSPEGFLEIFVFIFTLVFPELDIWEYKHAFEKDTISLFTSKLKCLEYKKINL